MKLLQELRRRARTAKWWALYSTHWPVAQLAFAVIGLLRLLGPDRASALGGAGARHIGRWLPTNRTGLANLAAAYPDMPEAERRRILGCAWENLGRTAAEYAVVDKLWDFDPDNPNTGRIEVRDIDIERFLKLRDDDKPAIIFTAHLANWEILPICAARYGLAVTALYRPPNNRFIARKILQLRADSMGGLIPSGRAASLAMAAVLERGEHLGLLVDQHLGQGLAVPFFGRPARTNTALARLARRYDCPVHGARVIRLPGNRFRVELTDELQLPRDEAGDVDVAGTTALVTRIVEGWVREHPEQWLWLHRRWRA